jgi:hypothetical protein
MKNELSLPIIIIYIIIMVGEVKCGYKAVTSNWDPVGKAAVIYTVSFLTGFGSIVGWIDIKDK